MLANFDDFGDGETLADGVKRKRIVGNMLILPAWGTHQILYANAGVEGAGNGAAVANLAKDDIVVQFHLYLLASIDTLGKGDPQSGAGDIENGSIDRFGGAGQDFELSGILGGIAGFGTALGGLFGHKKGMRESGYRMMVFVRHGNLLLD